MTARFSFAGRTGSACCTNDASAVTDHRLTIFDVQHGACALLKSDHDGLTWMTMIDCGHKNNDRGRWFPGDHLQSQNISTLDLLVISNLDEDHVSGFPNLLEREVNIRNIYSNPTVEPWAIRHLKDQYGMGAGIDAVVRELARRGLKQDLPWLPDADIRCYWNRYLFPFEDENNLSVITSLNLGGYRFLFTGDMECDGFNYLLQADATLRQEVKGVDFFIAPHHGRRSGVCEDLFKVHGCAPKLTIVSDDYVQYDTQDTCAFYRDKTSGHPFKSEGKTRWVLTTRQDGTLDFMASDRGGMFVF